MESSKKTRTGFLWALSPEAIIDGAPEVPYASQGTLDSPPAKAIRGGWIARSRAAL